MSKATGIQKWLYADELSGRFLMLPPEIFEEPAFQKLSHAARLFYIVLCVHKETEIQRGCLCKALTEYNQILNLGKTEQDILDEAMPNKRTKPWMKTGLFVAPMKQLEAYGYKANYAAKLKRELIDNGFIKVKYGGKGKFNGWNENVTVYQFVSDWKLKPTSP